MSAPRRTGPAGSCSPTGTPSGGDRAQPSGNLSASSGPTIAEHGEGPEASEDVDDGDERDVILGRNDRYLILGTERQVSGVSPVRSRWPEERSKSAVNDIVATQYDRGRWG